MGTIRIPGKPTVNFSVMFHRPCGTALFPPTEIRIGPGPGRKSMSLIRCPLPSSRYRKKKNTWWVSDAVLRMP